MELHVRGVNERRKRLEYVRRPPSTEDNVTVDFEPGMCPKQPIFAYNAKKKVRPDTPRSQQPQGSKRLNETGPRWKPSFRDGLNGPAYSLVLRSPLHVTVWRTCRTEKPAKGHES